MIAAAQGGPDGIDDPAQVHGTKWNDLNANGRRDPGEPGLSGVTVFSDLNNNGRLDDNEPRAVTMEDDPNTRFDETGLYWLDLEPGNHVIREVIPAGFVPTFPGRHARVTSSETGRFQTGVALDFDVTGVAIVPSPAVDRTTIDLEMTVVWPDSCGSIVTEMTTHTVVGNHILVQMYGEQVGDACAEVITPESQTIRIGDLEDNRYRVVGVLNEDLSNGGFVPTLAVVGGVAFAARGSHSLELGPGEVVAGIDFGNHLRNPGSAHGVKWVDRNGNGQRDPNEPGLPGVTIYSDLNFNGVLDEGEPRAVTMEDNPATAADETGLYWLEDLTPGLHVIREVVPDGFVQTFPRRFPFDIGTVEPLQLPFPGGAHVVRVEPGQAVENLHFGNRRIEPGRVHGTKWMDRNGNGQRENNEPGLPGVVIYSDLNGNGRLDDDEPHTRTMEDDPDTAVDETGLYWLRLDAGRHVIREIVPDGFRQTYPPIGPIPLPFAEIGFSPDIFPIVPGAHVVYVEPGGVVDGLDFGNRPLPGSVHGHKWNDLDGDGRQDPNEPGLPGVTIYADRNNNGQFDEGEPHTVTMEDDPVTDFDEGGLYWLDGLPPGRHVIREVVPDGFMQTFPPQLVVPAGDGEEPENEISSVDPEQIIVTLAAGEVFETQVSWSFAPICIRPFEVDVVATDPDVSFVNLTGVLLNSCGGDVSTFDVRMIGDGQSHFFELQFVDAEFGGVLDVIPVTILAPSDQGGAHVVHIEPGGVVEGRDFGNRPLPGSVHGRKWNDLDGDGRQDPNEPGLPGVTIYVDRNNNGQFDEGEPHTVTMEDDPVTDFDEGGLYWLDGLPPGRHVIREVVPVGFVQTFPPHVAVFVGDGGEPGGEFSSVDPEQIVVTLAAGEVFETQVSWSFDPICVRPFEVDVVATDPHVSFANLTGVLLNGCGGDVSTFDVRMIGDGRSHFFELQFVDAEFGGVLGVIPVAVLAPSDKGGAHIVRIEPGGVIEGRDFGNHRVDEPGSIHGRKWNDLDGNGRRDPNEPGLPGVTIYVDRNNNGRLDENERRTVTMEDDPDTAVDESGLYWLSDLRPGEHVVREVVPAGFVQTFPERRARVTSSRTGRFQEGIALDFDVTGVEIVPSTSADRTTIDLEMTVVWPDSCGSIVAGMTTHTVIGDHILVQMYGEQVGTICAEVISPESQTIRIRGLDENRYRVVGVLNEDLGSGDFVPTLAVVGGIEFAADGGRHVVRLGSGETVEDIDFGNHPRRPGSAHGVKWADRNGNGQREADEPGLPGVTIFSDLNFNGVFDEDEPHAVTMEDNPNTAVDEAGQYWLENLVPGLHVIREIVPDGFVQTFPRRFPFDLGTDEPLTLPFPGGAHVIHVQPGQAAENLDFGNRRIEPGSVHGTKWLDRNGNGRREDNEPGLPGVVIYSDLNGNRRLDDDEPRTRTLEDDPDTAVDETGLYWLRLEPGRHVIREVVPDGFVQTFPPFGPIPLPNEIGFVPDIFPWVGGAHVVFVEPGDTIEGLDFGNRRLLSGDFNRDGLLDCQDLRSLNEVIVAGSHASAFDVNEDGLVDFGDTRFWISEIYGTISGDANLDFHVNALDLNILGIHWRQSGQHLFWCRADFDGNHAIDANDLNELALNWRSSAAATASTRTPRAPLQAGATILPVEAREPLKSASQSLRMAAWRGEAVSDQVAETDSRFRKRIPRVDDYSARRNSQRPVPQSSPDRFERLADDVFADLAAFRLTR